jgi:outer membrane immunogenic protein
MARELLSVCGSILLVGTMLLTSSPAFAADTDSPYYNPYPNRAPAPEPPPYYYEPVVTKGSAPTPVFSWAGFYVGVEGFGAFGNSTWTIPGAGAAHIHTVGGMGGGELGYNWQMGNVVFGLETDASGGDVQGSVSNIGGCANTCTSQQVWFGSTRARVGYAYDRVWFYGTGGVAYGEVSGTLDTVVNQNGSSNNLGQTSSQTNVGWTAGAGMELAITGPWSVKVEYLFADLGKFTACNSATVGCAPPSTANFQENIVRVGFNHRF